MRPWKSQREKLLLTVGNRCVLGAGVCKNFHTDFHTALELRTGCASGIWYNMEIIES